MHVADTPCMASLQHAGASIQYVSAALQKTCFHAGFYNFKIKLSNPSCCLTRTVHNRLHTGRISNSAGCSDLVNDKYFHSGMSLLHILFNGSAFISCIRLPDAKMMHR